MGLQSLKRHTALRQDENSDVERRKVARRQGTFPVSLAVPGPIPLEGQGQSVNYSANGVLVIAHGKIPVFLGIKGKHYPGLLSRASPVDNETTAYAIELTEPLEV